MQAPGSVVLSTVDDKRTPITYGYEDKLYIYFRQGPIITVERNFGDRDRKTVRVALQDRADAAV